MDNQDQRKLDEKIKYYQDALSKNGNKTFLDGVSLYSNKADSAKDTLVKFGLDTVTGFAAGAMDSKFEKAQRDNIKSDASLIQAKADMINHSFRTG